MTTFKQLFASRYKRRWLIDSRRQRGKARYRTRGETLERRSMLAVSASISAGTLNITLDGESDAAFLSIAGSSYTVTDGSGAAVSGSPFSGVTARVNVAGATGSQSFTFGGATTLPVSLAVDSAIEAATINAPINASELAASTVSLSSATITVAADVMTSGAQAYAGAVLLVGSPSLTSTTAGVAFENSVDSYSVGFTPLASLSAGASPRAVSIGDLNGDGKPDLVIANGDSASVSVLLNATVPGALTPSYTPQATFSTGSNPRSVVIGDVNGDGKPDLAVANNGSNSVSVLLSTMDPGATTPSYSTQTAVDTGSEPRSISMVDMNGDGKPDLVVANHGSNSVSVFLSTTDPGAATPSYSNQATFAAGTSPVSVSASDLNGDGKPDLAVANDGSNSVSVLLSTTTPGSTIPSYRPQATFATGRNPASVAISDLNGDGKPDLAVANGSSNSASVLINLTAPGTTTPSFSPQAAFPTGLDPRSVSLGDLNGDGKPDLAVANRRSNTAGVLLNTTSPGATTPSYSLQTTFAAGASPYCISIGDVNGDGKPDLAIANSNSDSAGVLVNTAPDTMATPLSYSAQATFAAGREPRAVSIGDLNGDGKPDLAVSDLGSNSVSVLLSTTAPGATTPSYSSQTTFAAGVRPGDDISIGDVNGDGKPDLAVANLFSNSVSVLLNSTVPGAATPVFLLQATFATDSYPASLSIGDLNGDGKPDLATANTGSNSVSVLVNMTIPGATTPSYAPQVTFATGSNPRFSSIGDVNGDGKPDLVVSNAYADSVSVLLNTTAPGATMPSYAPQVTFSTGTKPHAFSIRDVNGDGKPDLAVSNYGSDYVSVLLNTTVPGGTAPSYLPQATFAVGPGQGFQFLSTGDLNFDGKPDLVVSSSNCNFLSVLLNTTAPGATAPSYAPQATFATGKSNRWGSIGDVNGDGKQDLAVIVRPDMYSMVAVLLNTMAPPATTPSALVVSSATGTAFAAAVGGMTPLQSLTIASGPVSLGSAVTTAGPQTYKGAVTLAGDTTLTGTAPTFNAGVAGGGHSLTLNFSGTMAIDGAKFTGINNLATGSAGTTTLKGAITTAGAQAYANAVLLVGSPSLTSTTETVSFQSTVDTFNVGFAAQTTFAVGSQPASISIGDVNGDGKPDLAVANAWSNFLSVLLNTTPPGATTSSYAAQQSLYASGNQSSVLIGDLNSDGKPDLATTEYPYVCVYPNTTAPGATTPSYGPREIFYPVGSGPASVVAGDVNGDGKPDLAFANSYTYSHSVSVLLNTTAQGAITPSYAPRVTFDTGYYNYRPVCLAIGDVNSDGKPDLAVATATQWGRTDSVTVLLNTTLAGATTPSYSTMFTLNSVESPTSVAIGDFNSDGKPDLAVANHKSLSVLLNTTATGATTPSYLPQATFPVVATYGSKSISIGDLNGDGKSDVAITNYGSNSVSVLLNAMASGATIPAFRPQLTFATGERPSSVVMGDVNGDSKLDLAITNRVSNSVSVLLNTTAPGATILSNLTVSSVKGAAFAGTVGGAATLESVTIANGPMSLGADVITAGPQTYHGAVTLASNAVLSGTTITTKSVVAGAAKSLVINGNAVVGGTITGLTSYAVSGTTSLGANVMTTGTQTYTGAVTLAASTTLSGTAPTFTTGVIGGGNNLTLNFSGTTAIEGAKFTGINSLATGDGGTTTLTGAITTDGDQNYADAVVIAGSASLISVYGVVGFQGKVDANSNVTLADQANFTTGGRPDSVAIGDVNGDGKLDIAVANSYSDSVSVLLNTTVPGATSPYYAPQATFATGPGPSCVTIGDVNADGKPDLVVANAGSGFVSVLLNTTAPGGAVPSYAPQTTFAAGGQPYALAIGDINSDGKPDIAVTNLYSRSVSVLLNTTAQGATTPSYASQATFATEQYPWSVSLGDVNGDGKPDLAVANRYYYSNSVSVLLNKTTSGATVPAFAPQATFATGLSPTSVTIGDVNGDGKPDLAVANVNAVSVLLNTMATGATTPSYSPQTTFAAGGQPYALAIGDVNGDGKLDLAVTNPWSTTLSVLLNGTAAGGTSPSYSAPATFATGTTPRSLSIGDVNGDGKPDIAVANSYSNSVSVLLNTTGGDLTVRWATGTTFAAAVGGTTPLESVTIANGPTSLGGDVTTSGAQIYAGTVTLAANTTLTGTTPTLRGGVIGGGNSLTLNFSGRTAIDGANFTGIHSLTTGKGGMTTLSGGITTTGAQVYADAVLLAGAATLTSTNAAVVFQSTVDTDSSVRFTPRAIFATEWYPAAVAVGDVNGDGKPDFAVANNGSNSVSVLLNTTTPGATFPLYSPQATFAAGSGPAAVSMGDISGDGKPDLVLTNYYSDSVSVLLNTTIPGATTATYATQATFATGSFPYSVSIGDVNVDGRPDLVVTNWGSSSISVLLNMTAPGAMRPSYFPQATFAVGSLPGSVSMGDMNGDGRLDLAVANAESGTVSVLLNTTTNGATTPSFSTQATFAAGSGSTTVVIGDVNGDGKPDLAIGNNRSESVSVLLNTMIPGATIPSYSTQATFATGDFPSDISICDLNGDGKPDLAVTNNGSDSVSVLLNTTTPGATVPSYSPQATFATGFSPIAVSNADFNGDGKRDLVVANIMANSACVLLNATGVGSLTVSSASGTVFAAAVGGTTPVESVTVASGVTRLGANVTTTIVPLAGGTITLSPSQQTTIGGLNLNAGGLVDVGSGMATVASGLSTADLVAAIVTGMGDGSWNGTRGITSSVSAASGGNRTIGWLDNGDGSVAFAFAAPGDTNLDWTIDIIDVANFLAGARFDSGLAATWNQGDFTYDGVADILDAASFLSSGLYDAGEYNPPSAARSVMVANNSGFMSPWDSAFASFAAAYTVDSSLGRKKRTVMI